MSVPDPTEEDGEGYVTLRCTEWGGAERKRAAGLLASGPPGGGVRGDTGFLQSQKEGGRAGEWS